MKGKIIEDLGGSLTSRSTIVPLPYLETKGMVPFIASRRRAEYSLRSPAGVARAFFIWRNTAVEKIFEAENSPLPAISSPPCRFIFHPRWTAFAARSTRLDGRPPMPRESATPCAFRDGNGSNVVPAFRGAHETLMGLPGDGFQASGLRQPRRPSPSSFGVESRR